MADTPRNPAIEIVVPTGHFYLDRTEIREVSVTNTAGNYGPGWGPPCVKVGVIIPHTSAYALLFKDEEAEVVLNQLAEAGLINEEEARERGLTYNEAAKLYAKAAGLAGPPADEGQPIIIFAGPTGAAA